MTDWHLKGFTYILLNYIISMKKEFWITKSFLKFIKQQQTENELHALISSTQKLRDACCIELIDIYQPIITIETGLGFYT